jgi:DNA polymerase (family 10)
MDNKTLAAQFNLLASLMELHGENAFKTKAYANAYLALRKLDKPVKDMTEDELDALPGIGSSVLAMIKEFVATGQIARLEAYTSRTPEGIRQLLGVKGLGPKKVKVVWEALQVESPAELLYACEENRLVALPGFGEKTQEDLRKKIEYFLESADRLLYGQVEQEMNELLERLARHLPGHSLAWAGGFAARQPVLDEITLLIAPPVGRDVLAAVPGIAISREEEGGDVHILVDERITVRVRMIPWDDLAAAWRDQTLMPGLARRIEGRALHAGEHPSAILDGTAWAGLPEEWYDREGVEDAQPADWAELVTEADIRGILHNHSTWSDGAHTLEEMALHVRDAGYGYFAICDHSRSAFYANGLSEERVLAQMDEIDRLNAAMAPFRIYKGIESDILGDGSLDYPDDILRRFELVVASVHSNLRMDEDKATARLIRAIENPYTHILGHPTGRLLLARPGYPIDHRKVIDACAANGVAIELNANPLRLDIDHSWIPYCMEKGVPVSINPDAHSRGQVRYVRYGVMAARRGGLKKADCLNTRDLQAFEAWRKGKG